MDEKGNNEQVTSTWSLDKRTIAKCKNLDKIEIIGASDVIDYDVETNVEGGVLYPDAINTYTPNVFSYFLVPDTERETLWKVGFTPWPSTFNPKMKRRTAALGDQWLQAQYNPLQHHFFYHGTHS